MAKRTIPRTCEHCLSPFLAEAHEINKGNARFCSRACFNRFIRAGQLEQLICVECKKAFKAASSKVKRGTKYCGGECRKAANTLERRFWRSINTSSGQGPNGDCWQWTACTNTDGYGIVKHMAAHRVSWILHNGPIPDRLGVLHRCDNPPCVKPEHLFVGTQADNMRDMCEKGRNKGKGRTVLTDEQVREIRRRYQPTKTSYAKLGKEFGVSGSAVNHIVHRRTHADLVLENSQHLGQSSLPEFG